MVTNTDTDREITTPVPHHSGVINAVIMFSLSQHSCMVLEIMVKLFHDLVACCCDGLCPVLQSVSFLQMLLTDDVATGLLVLNFLQTSHRQMP